MASGGRALALFRSPSSASSHAALSRVVAVVEVLFRSLCSLSLPSTHSLSPSVLHPPNRTHRLYVLVASMHQKSTWWKRTTWVF